MVIEKPFYSDFDMFLEKGDALDREIREEVVKQEAVAEEIYNEKDRRAQRMGALINVPSNHTMQMLDTQRRLEVTEDDLITEMKESNKLSSEVLEMKRKLAQIRRLLEIKTNDLSVEERHYYLMQVEYRKLHAMMIDYMKFIHSQLQNYFDECIRIPVDVMEEYHIHLNQFKQVKRLLKSKLDDMQRQPIDEL